MFTRQPLIGGGVVVIDRGTGGGYAKQVELMGRWVGIPSTGRSAMPHLDGA